MTISPKQQHLLVEQITRDLKSVYKKSVLVDVLKQRVEKVISPFGLFLSLYNKDTDSFFPYLIDADKEILARSEWQDVLKHDYRFDKEITRTLFEEKIPHLSFVEEPAAIHLEEDTKKIVKQAGFQQFLNVPILLDKQKVGLLTLSSPSRDPLPKKMTELLQEIAEHVSVTVSNIIALESLDQANRERTSLLNISVEIAKARDKSHLLFAINEYLRDIIPFTNIAIGVISPDGKTHRFLLNDHDEELRQRRDFKEVVGALYPIKDGFFERAIAAGGPALWFKDAELKRKVVPEYMLWGTSQMGTKELITVPLTDFGKNIGMMYLPSDKNNNFKEHHLKLLHGIAANVSTAVANILINEENERQTYEKSVLLSFSNSMATAADLMSISVIVRAFFKEHFDIKEYLVMIRDTQHEGFRYLLHDIPTADAQCIKEAGEIFKVDERAYEEVCKSEDYAEFRLPAIFEQGRYIISGELCSKEGIPNRLIGLSLRVAGNELGVIWLSTTGRDLDFLRGVCSQIAISIANALANEKVAKQLEEISRYKEQLEAENLYLQEEVNTKYNYDEFVGSGDAMQHVYKLISEVAYTTSAVLILGETGTGKELVARAIHNESPRKSRVMVKVNCAALPPSLIESELFGHEKGSFTGAIEQRIGKFELANRSTLFLDEIGELPLDLQVKLLRVLQEKEIERVGGKSTIKVNVRIVAATNRDLIKEMKEGRFRSDLYYRLNVFPIVLPPLRERRADIPSLTMHFIKQFARTSGKRIDNISQRTMKQLQAYDWPGNIRELEHLIERSVLLAKSNIIKEVPIPIPGRDNVVPAGERGVTKTLEEMERDYIIDALKKCNGKRFGHGGAAELLDVNISTLNSKIRKLGIKKEQLFS